MDRSGRTWLPLARLLAIGGLALALVGTRPQLAASEFVVVYGASAPAARAAIAFAGGVLLHENAAVGVATVRSAEPGFADRMAAAPAVVGVVRNGVVGRAPRELGGSGPGGALSAPALEAGTAQAAPAQQSGGEPLAGQQWDMQQINAPAAHRRETGDSRVLVGVIDTGIDGSHPDIAPNFNPELSRNFVPDGDAADVDEGGHGTHVAGTIAAPLNGIGIAGVAPGVSLVNLRAGNDDGYFFLQPTVDALTYAGDIGVDVVNMSLYIDPWLYNCANNPADSAAAQREQQTILTATQRALDYARGKGVTLISAAGNESTDLGDPGVDTTSPNYPEGAAYERTVDNSCLNLPAEGQGVISVTALGPSGRKAIYSNYGVEQADLAAPGGDTFDYPGTRRFRTVQNRVLAPFPEALLRAEGDLATDGTPTAIDVVRSCTGSVCSYYRYLEGTSMAAPHAVGVAALVISHYGRPDPAHPGGLTMDPVQVEQVLVVRARNQACPAGGRLEYGGLPVDVSADCAGDIERNGFYGAGIADALRAITVNNRPWPARLLAQEITPLDAQP